MSVRVMSWVWHGAECADVAGNELVLLQALADVADDAGRCRYVTDDEGLTYEALAKKARVDRRTIIRLVAKLRERGLIEQEKGARGRPNEFVVVVPWAIGDKVSPLLEADSVTAETDSVTPSPAFGDNSSRDSSSLHTDVGRTPARVGVPSEGKLIEEAFEEFWAIYPRKVSKGAARTAFAAAVRKLGSTLPILAGARRFSLDPNLPAKKHEQFIPHPATWLRGERWGDGPLPDRGWSQGQQARDESALDLIARLQAEEQASERRQIGARS